MKRVSSRLWRAATALYLFLYAPIAVVVVYSFNSARFGVRWEGFTTRWYGALMENSQALTATQNTLLLAIINTMISTVLGTLLGYGLSGHPFLGAPIVGRFI